MKVLVVSEVHPVFFKIMQEAKFKCTDASKWTEAKIKKELPNYQGLVIRSEFDADKIFIEQNSHLKFIGRPGSGLERIDLKTAAKKEIEIIRSPEGNCNAVAEHALGMLLSAIRNINSANAEVKKLLWKRKANSGIELEGKTIGIIGYGNTGSAFARNLAGFNVKLLAYDKYIDIANAPAYVTQCKMTQLFKECDVLSLHIPYSKETSNLVNNDFLKRFKKDIILINTSRGTIVNTKDLFKHIKSKHVTHACLDVLEFETPDLKAIKAKDKAWLKNFVNHPNVLVTPHIAGVTHESKFKMGKVLAEKIIREFVV